MKKYLFLILVSGLMLLLTGCRKGMNGSDIRKYVKKSYGFSDFEVNPNPVIVDGDDGYKDEIWTVTTKDTPKTEFEVLVHRTLTSSAGLNTVLRDNYYGKVLERVIGNYNLEYLGLTENNRKGYRTYEITGHFTNAAELKALCEEAGYLRDTLHADGIELAFDTAMWMDTPFADRLTPQPDGSEEYRPGDCVYRKIFHTKDAGTESEKTYKEALETLVRVALDYRLEDSLVGIPEKQLSEIVNESCKKIGIVRDGNAECIEYYDDMCANQMGYGISFGNLYEVLEREGFAVEGDENHYSFEGADGNVYEISYDFVDELEYRNGTHRGYYYRKNGEVIPMMYYFYNHFSQKEVETMTGLKLVW